MLMLLGITEPTTVVVNIFGNYFTMVDSGGPTNLLWFWFFWFTQVLKSHSTGGSGGSWWFGPKWNAEFLDFIKW